MVALALTGCNGATPAQQVITVTATPQPEVQAEVEESATPTEPSLAPSKPTAPPPEPALPAVTTREVRDILSAYGFEDDKSTFYEETASLLSKASLSEREEWLNAVVRASKRMNPGVAKDISASSTLAEALGPWIEYFAMKAQVPAELVDWESSYAILKTRISKTPVTREMFDEWLYEDSYFYDTPGGRAEQERIADIAGDVACSFGFAPC